MWFATIAWFNLLHRKVRSALTCVGIAVACCAFVTIVNITEAVPRATIATYESRGVDIIVCPQSAPQRVTGRLPETIGGRLKEVPGVTVVEPSLMDIVSLEDTGLIGVLVLGWVPGGRMLENIQILSGRSLTPEDHHGVLLGMILANDLQKKVGDVLRIEDAEFTVVGIFEGTNVLENGAAIVSLADLQPLMGREGEVTLFHLRVEPALRHDAQAVQAICRRLEALRDEQGRSLRISALPMTAHVSESLEFRILGAMGWSMSVIALFIGAIGMLNTMIISIFERTREIGTLLVLGWGRARIAAMILIEALLLCSAGTAVGLLMSWGLTAFISSFEAASNIVPRSVTPSILGQGILLTFAAGLAGAIWPAIRATMMQPSESLRYE